MGKKIFIVGAFLFAFFGIEAQAQLASQFASGSCIDINAQSTAQGAVPHLWQCNSAWASQNFIVQANGSIEAFGGTIENDGAPLCMEIQVPASGPGNGMALLLENCNGSANQTFNYDSITGVIMGTGENANYCLDINADQTANGTALHMWSCIANWPSQKWTASMSSSLPVTTASQIVNQLQPNPCIDINDQAKAPGAIPHLWQCANYTSQFWNFTASGAITAYSGQIESGGAPLCMQVEVPSSGPSNGMALLLENCNGSAIQTFSYNTATQQIQGTGSLSNYCLDINADQTGNGTALHMWSCIPNWQSQVWTFNNGNLNYPAANAVPPVDSREITFPNNPSDMAAWGVLDVTQNGEAVGCPDAIPNATDTASVTQTTQAIQCRLNILGQSTPQNVWNFYPASLYFPAGNYYINQSLALTVGYWTTNSSGANTFVKYGVEPRSNSTGFVKISGENPATTKILWAGSCGTDPNVASPSTVTKYNDIFYVSGVSPLTIERLTLDGQNCAGDGIDMVSNQGIISGVHINEMNIQNLKEVGIVGDRASLTTSENLSGDGSGMVSEVTISQVNFSNIGYAAVMPNTYNALDYWIRDSVFSNCNIGVTTSATVGGVWGMTGDTPLKWPNAGYGGFEVANCLFENSLVADIVQGGWNAPTAVRNSYSIASHGPFIAAEAGVTLVQGNTVVASQGVIPITLNGGTDGVPTPQVVLLGNKFVTQNNDPAVLGWTSMYGSWPNSAYQGASAAFGTVFDETYSSIASFGNEYTSTKPFSTASLSAYLADTGVGLMGNYPGWTPSSSFYQCGPTGSVATELDNRTYCNYASPQSVAAFNLATEGDTLGASLSPTPPIMPPFRPEIHRNYIVANGLTNNTSSAAAALASANANDTILQTAINTLATKAAACPSSEYYCADRWGILFIPSGMWPVANTLNIPGNVQIQIVGTGETVLYWEPWTGSPAASGSGPSAIFNFEAPSHIVMRDLSLYGIADVHNPNPLGEGFVAQVNDSSSSRVLTDNMRNGGSFVVTDIGNTPFEMKSFANGGSGTIMGNGSANTGFFAYFGGNPSSLTVGKGANLMVQDTWYEGSNSNMVTCASGDSANITYEASMLSMGGWHGVSNSSQTTFNIAGCNTKTAIIDSNLQRDGWTGYAPTQSVILPAGGSSSTQLLMLDDTSNNSTYGNSQETIPTTYTGTATSLDQGYLLVEPGSAAQYENLEGTFLQSTSDNGGSGFLNIAAKNAGTITAAFTSSLLGQAMDPRQAAPSMFVPPITDMAVTDIQIYNVDIQGTRMDMQFILPGAAAQ